MGRLRKSHRGRWRAELVCVHFPNTRTSWGSFYAVPSAVCFSPGARRSPSSGAARAAVGGEESQSGCVGEAQQYRQSARPFQRRGRRRFPPRATRGSIPRRGAAGAGDAGAVIPGGRGRRRRGAERRGAGLPAASARRAGRSEGNLCRLGLGLSSAPPAPGNDHPGGGTPPRVPAGSRRSLCREAEPPGPALLCPRDGAFRGGGWAAPLSLAGFLAELAVALSGPAPRLSASGRPHALRGSGGARGGRL